MVPQIFVWVNKVGAINLYKGPVRKKEMAINKCDIKSILN